MGCPRPALGRGGQPATRLDARGAGAGGPTGAPSRRLAAPRAGEKRVTGAARSHTKGPKTRLRVTFADGQSVEEYYAADTFALALTPIRNRIAQRRKVAKDKAVEAIRREIPNLAINQV
jgi:hypothetical protein